MNNTPSISNQERDLVLAVSSGSHEAILEIYRIRELCRIAKDLDYLHILKWLVKQDFTGPEFIHLLKVQHENSVLKLVTHVRQKITNDYKIRKVMARGLA